jgi:hypothetical protein
VAGAVGAPGGLTLEKIVTRLLASSRSATVLSASAIAVVESVPDDRST